MAIDLRTNSEPSLTSLVSGIVDDVQELTKQQLALFKQEIRDDLHKCLEIAISWAFGLGAALIGVFLLFQMLVYVLHETAGLPLWSSYGLVGTASAVLGAGLFYAGKKKLEDFSPLRSESVQALKENVQCLMNPK